jgi:hypothetical protein
MTATENNESILPGHHSTSRAPLAEHGPPKEVSRNPTGRLNGFRYVDVEALNHLKGIDATIELCKQVTDAKNDTRREGDPKERARLYDLIVAAQFTRALQENDLLSFKELADRYEGAVAQRVENVTPEKDDQEILDLIEGERGPPMYDSGSEQV